MGRKGFIGEFEQVVLLAALQLKDGAHAPAIGRMLEEDAGRPVSRGALYSTLDRLERKGLLEWHIEARSGEGDGLHYTGDSALIGPMGEVLALAKPGAPGASSADMARRSSAGPMSPRRNSASIS